MVYVKLVVLAVPALFFGRLLVLFVSFRRVAPLLGHVNEYTPLDTSTESAKARRIGAVLLKVSRYLPWRCRCLEQAIAGLILLRLHGLSGTIYFGVRKCTGKQMQAHAWLRCGNHLITGAAGHQWFSVIFTVASMARVKTCV